MIWEKEKGRKRKKEREREKRRGNGYLKYCNKTGRLEDGL